jgi:hypothetical protein
VRKGSYWGNRNIDQNNGHAFVKIYQAIHLRFMNFTACTLFLNKKESTVSTAKTARIKVAERRMVFLGEWMECCHGG